MFDALIAFLSAHSFLYVAIVGLYGLVLGSFLNVVIHRLPIMLERRWTAECREFYGETAEEQADYSLISPRSHCPHCNHKITALENIPLVSYLVLRGRCAGCGAAISLRYPMVELLTAACSMLVAWRFGVSLTALAALALTWSLIPLIFIDYDHYLLPDAIVMPVLWLGLLVNTGALFVPLDQAVIGAAAAYLFLWLIFQAFRLMTGKEGMGYGDFKLFALFGAWLGLMQLPLLILIAAASGALIGAIYLTLSNKGRDHPIPFGPFLGIAGFIVLIWGEGLSRALGITLRL